MDDRGGAGEEERWAGPEVTIDPAGHVHFKNEPKAVISSFVYIFFCHAGNKLLPAETSC